MCNQPVKVDTLKLYFFLLSNWEKKNAVTYFLLQIVKKKKKKMLTLLVSALYITDCADTWIIFHILIFCWNENLQGALRLMGGTLMSIKWCVGTHSEKHQFSSCTCHVEESWLTLQTGCWWCLGLEWQLSTATLLTWAFLRQEDPMQGLCVCHQCDHSGHLDAASGLFIV